MKANPDDFDLFFGYLFQLAQFGNGQSREEARVAGEVLEHFRQAKVGILGRKCACGKDGFTVAKLQPCAHWPIETYVVCRDHATLLKQYNDFMEQIVTEDKPKSSGDGK